MTEFSLDGDLSAMKKKKLAAVDDDQPMLQSGATVPVMQIIPEGPKSSLEYVVLPTGYLDESGKLHKDVHLREMSGEEEDILTSRKMAVHLRLGKILENCVLSIGEYEQNSTRWRTIIKDLVATDRLYLILQLRILSLGPLFSAKMKCEECGYLTNQHVDLNHFKIGGLKDPTKRTWSGVLPNSQLKYIAKAQTGWEEAKLAEHAESKDLMSLALLGRLVELDGKTTINLAMIKKLGFVDRQHLRKEFGEREGDLDKSMEYECPECGHENKEGVDIASANFFFPSETQE